MAALEDHATGLVRFLSLVEFVARRRLVQEGTCLAGLDVATDTSPTERLLEAFREIALTMVGGILSDTTRCACALCFAVRGVGFVGGTPNKVYETLRGFIRTP